jgi:ethanolamine utilization protein EutA
MSGVPDIPASPERSQGLAWSGAARGLFLHEIGRDHYHDDDDYDLDFDPEIDGLWQADNVDLVSVGIDIGSSGTQVIFSLVRMRRQTDHLSSRYSAVSREQLYQSPIALTPYARDGLIDKDALAAIIDDAYREAKITPELVDTGAVILTGEALRRENARHIAEILAGRGGQFVCTMAGHHIEAMLAGYGSGAAWASNERGERILNIDIGGGTTKFAILERGRVTATAAIHVGGRLHVFDAGRALTRLEPAGRHLAAEAGMDWALGRTVTEAEIDRLAQWMADAIVAAATEARPSEAVRALFLTDPLPSLEDIASVMFSGGVSEYVYGSEAADFGDMGKVLGARLAARIAGGGLPWPVLPKGTGIRATALGLSEYSVQLSGNTIFVSDPEAVLPRRNLRVVRPPCTFPDIIEPSAVAASIASHLAKYGSEDPNEEIALAFEWRGLPTHARISAFAAGITLGLGKDIRGRRPLSVVLDGDIARTLGRILRDELHVAAPLLVVDGVLLSDFDYIDFGRMRQPSQTVPVTIKSLLFSRDPRDKRNRLIKEFRRSSSPWPRTP